MCASFFKRKSKALMWVSRSITCGVSFRDNGPEIRLKALAHWAKQHQVKLLFMQLGKPTQNAIIERFNGTYGREILNAYLFKSIKQVQLITDQWLDEYNNIRPHASVGNVP